METQQGSDVENKSVDNLLKEGRQRSSVWAQCIFLLAIMLITFCSFFVLNFFVTDMIRAERDRVSGQAVRDIVDRFSSYEITIDRIASYLSSSEELGDDWVAQHLVGMVPDVEKFEHVIRARRDKQGEWIFQDIYFKDKRSNISRRYSLSGASDVLDKIHESEGARLGRVRAFVNLPFIIQGHDVVVSAIHQEPFALVKSLTPGASQGEYIIGVTTAGNVLRPEWAGQNTENARVSIREINENVNIYNFERGGTYESGLSEFSHTYEFMFGGRKWELMLQFYKDRKMYWLSLTPVFFGLFGLAMIAFGTFYLRQNLNQLSGLSRVYDAVEKKNSELQEEMIKRESLDRALKKAERENKSIIDAVSDIIFEADVDGKILFLNARWTAVTGFEVEQSIGMDLFSLLPREDHRDLRLDFNLLVAGQGKPFRAITKLRVSDGSFRAVELAVSMIRQDENKDLRVVGTFTDVEERRRAEHALGEAEKKYRAIVENAAGGIFQMTPEGMYLSVNPAMARILGYESPQAVLREIKDANESVYGDLKGRQAFIRELENRDVINNYEAQVYKKDGEKIWVNENVRVVRDENGKTLYYEGSLADITKRKETDIQLREAKMKSDMANRAKSEFLANMSHELRTPLNAIIGFSEIIKSQSLGEIKPPSYLEYAGDIYDSGKRLLGVINEILDISKIEAGERPLNDNILVPSDVIEGCIDLLSNKAKGAEVTVTSVYKDTSFVVAEEVALKQILINLLSNAIKFTPSGGRVTIGTDTDEDGQFRISVTDTGIGINEGDIPKILSPFGQVNNELSRTNSGTGLGLTLVDALMKLHGGTLEIFSQKGMGTTVTIVFPVSRVTKAVT